MHQEHNIPWNLLAQNLTFVPDDPERHFNNPPIFHIMILRELASSHAEADPGLGTQPFRSHFARHGGYVCEDGDFADAVNYLLGENEMDKILFLAHHPKVPLHTLQNLWQGYTGFGFGFVAEGAMDAYVFFNLCSAMNLLRNGLYMRTKRYEAMIGRLNYGMRYSAQQIPHRQFYFPDGYNYQSNARQPHLNLSHLEEYLKQLFRLLYRYEFLCRECGVESQ